MMFQAWSKGRNRRDHTSGVIQHLQKSITYSSVFVSQVVRFCLLKPQDGPLPPMEAFRIAVVRGKRWALFLSHPAESIVLIFLVTGNYISSFSYNLLRLTSVSSFLNFEHLNIKEFLLW